MKSRLLSERTMSIPPTQLRIIFEKAQRMKDVIRLEIGEPDFDTPTHIRDAAKKALDEGYTHYTSSAGIKDLRDSIADKMEKENHISVDPDKEVVVTAGSCCAIYLAVMATVNQGEEVLLPDPIWPLYEGCVRLAGGVALHYPLLEKNRFKIDPGDLKKRITEKTKMLVITNPSNPTGSIETKRELKDIADVVLENDILVVADEVYEKLIYGGLEHFSLGSMPEMREKTITVNGFSKTYAMTGWRVGYAVTNEEIVEEMAKLNLYLNTCVNAAAQWAATAALKGPQDCVREMVKEYEKRREVFIDGLNLIPGISCIKPDGAFYSFANVSSFGMSSFDFSMKLLEEARVSTTPGSSFGRCGEGYIRLSYARSIEELEEALRRIEEALK
ncbi:MAG: aminotransferase class I/II-fold pyridoxal phosphate-dependent enzyme [Nitrososphaeria archaeon]|nr:aminotransferase class I/II-fold pyridoxal phosphate-dependent enzyme [Nitrososphaeria archaeon]